MYGQTNCWLQPEINYIAFKTKSGDVFVCTARSARNMSFQGFTAADGTFEKVADLTGRVRTPVLYVYNMFNV